jgi:hypothetical protein
MPTKTKATSRQNRNVSTLEQSNKKGKVSVPHSPFLFLYLALLYLAFSIEGGLAYAALTKRSDAEFMQ